MANRQEEQKFEKQLLNFFLKYDRRKMFLVPRIVKKFAKHRRAIMRHLHEKYETGKAYLYEKKAPSRLEESEAAEESQSDEESSTGDEESVDDQGDELHEETEEENEEKNAGGEEEREK